MVSRVTEFVAQPVEEEDELNFARIKQILGLIAHAPRRHPRLAALVILVTLTLGVLYAVFAPRWYQSDVRVLAQKNQVLPALGNPSRQHEAESPTKNATDAIVQRDNIVAMIKQLELIDRWKSTRQPILRLKDKIVTAVSGPRSDEESMLDMIGFLEKQLVVTADDSSITIAVEWPNRELSYEIIEYLQKSFLEARYDTNVNVITEAIKILEQRAKPEAAEVDAALADLNKTIETQSHGGMPVVEGGAMTMVTVHRGGGRAAPAAAKAAGQAGDDSGESVAEQLDTVRRRIRMMKEDREHELMQAQNQLADARATLGPMHPTVVGLNQKIAELTDKPSELKGLQARERALVAQLAQGAAPSPSPAPGGGGDTTVAVPAPAPRPVAQSSGSSGRADLLRDNPEVALAMTKLQSVSAKYNDMLGRIEAANIELEMARAAFKYQYTIVRPAELARKPSRPNTPLVLIIAILAALLLGVAVPGLVDLKRGRFVERWQVERELELPILGELMP